MAQFMGILSFLVSVYMGIIFIRIVLTWFTGIGQGSLQDILARITDPYLNWFRRFQILRIGYIDLSPIVALGVLSVVNRILGTIAVYNTISLGIILAMVLSIAWGVVSFFLGFLIVILILRLVVHLMRLDAYSPFWRIIDGISRPVLFRINRLFFRDRIIGFTASIIISILALGIVYLALKFIVAFVSGMLVRLPV